MGLRGLGVVPTVDIAHYEYHYPSSCACAENRAIAPLTYLHCHILHTLNTYSVILHKSQYSWAQMLHIYTYYMFDSALYLCPAWGVKLEKCLDVSAQGKRSSKITLSVYHACTINIQAFIMSRPNASHTLTPVQA